MPSFYYITIWSILLPLIISLVRLRKIATAFYPFLFVIWAGCVNELIAHFIVSKGYSNAIPSNIFTLMEACFIVWFFYRMELPKYIRKIWLLLIASFIFSWIIENIFLGRLEAHFNSYFNILSGFAIVLISINVINDLLVKETELLRNPLFLLCIAFIVYFTYRILVEAFWLSGQNISREFMIKVYDIHSWINLVCNIIFAFAILWMQKKQAFTLQYS